MEKSRNQMIIDNAANDPAVSEGNGLATNLYDEEFWRTENLKFGQPWYRLEKSAPLITSLANGKRCTLLDIGCGPATMMGMLPKTIEYFGIDIAIQNPAPNLREIDLVENPIAFDDNRFDIVIAQGVFEYFGAAQQQKFAEIAAILRPAGTFVVSYTKFRASEEVYF